MKNKLRTIALRITALVMLAPASAFSKSQDFVVTTLGTGTPTPVLDRMGAATLVEVADKKLLFDAGRGVLIQLNRAKVPAGSLDGLFLTHLHSDHINGLPDLFLAGCRHLSASASRL